MPAQVKLGLVHEDPPARPAIAELKRRPEHVSERAGCNGMPRRRPWMRHQAAEQNLGHQVLRHRQQVLVSCGTLCGLGHRNLVAGVSPSEVYT